MGNAALSSRGNPIYLSPDLKWKTDSGKRAQAVPFSVGIDEDQDIDSYLSAVPYETIFKSVAFKEYILANIDSDYLVSSILCSGATDDKILLDGIKQCNVLDADAKSETVDKIDQFEQCVRAGIDVSLCFCSLLIITSLITSTPLTD
jgi:hypothetical protein